MTLIHDIFIKRDPVAPNIVIRHNNMNLITSYRNGSMVISTAEHGFVRSNAFKTFG